MLSNSKKRMLKKNNFNPKLFSDGDYFTPIKLNEVVINTESYLWTRTELMVIRERHISAIKYIEKIKKDEFIIYNKNKHNLSDNEINSVILFMLYNSININIDPPYKIFNILKLFYGKTGRYFNIFYYRHFNYKNMYKFNYNEFVPNVARVDYFYEAFKSYFGYFFK